MYQYDLDLGTDADGNVRALFWQATPGCFQVRADLAEKYQITFMNGGNVVTWFSLILYE